MMIMIMMLMIMMLMMMRCFVLCMVFFAWYGEGECEEKEA